MFTLIWGMTKSGLYVKAAHRQKKIAPATRPFGLPGASRIGRSLWNSLALKQPQRLFARFYDARRGTKEGQTPCGGQPLLRGLYKASRYAGGESPNPLPEKLEACLEDICMATVHWRWCFAILNPCANIVKHQTGFLVEIPVQASREIEFLSTLNSLTV